MLCNLLFRPLRVGFLAVAMIGWLGMSSTVEADPVPLQQPTATFSQSSPFNISRAIDTNSGTGWAVCHCLSSDPNYGQFNAETAVFETVTDVGFGGPGTILTFKLDSQFGPDAGGPYLLGRFRFSVTTDNRSEFADGIDGRFIASTGEQIPGDVSANWVVLDPLNASATEGVLLSKLEEDNSLLASNFSHLPPGPPYLWSTYTVTAHTTLQNITGFRLEALKDPRLPGATGGPGTHGDGNFVLTNFTIDAVQGPAPTPTVPIGPPTPPPPPPPAVSPFSTAVQALPGINLYAQYDPAGLSANHYGTTPGYANTVGGGLMAAAGGGFNNPQSALPNDSTSAAGAPLVGVTGGPNLSLQNRPASLPGGVANNPLYTTVAFRAQPDPASPQNQATAFYAGGWVKNLSNTHSGANVDGDYSSNGVVDAADYTVWRDSLSGTSLPNEGGISPGTVDQADYDFWKSRFGSTGSGATGFDDINQVIMSRRPFVGNNGEGIDNVPGDDSWHLFMRDDDGSYGGAGKLSWQMGDGDNLINFESTVNPIDGDWHFVAFSYNGNPTDPNALSLFVDGSSVATTRTVTGSAAAMSITSTGADWRLAVGNSPGMNNIWDGPIDETFLGFGQLSALQVANLWNLATTPGSGNGSVVGAVPEPSSVALALLAGFMLVSAGGRRCR